MAKVGMFNGWTGSRGPDPRMEIRQRILELYLAMHRKERDPNLFDIKEIAWILRELDRQGLLEPQQGDGGIFGQIGRTLGLSPGMVWLTVVLLAMLIGQPFVDFLRSIWPLG